MYEIDAVVVGAGIVGLAVARELSLLNREVLVLESEGQIGMHTSSRNSEVIHAGIYYPKDSLKAKLCVNGKERLYAYSVARRVEHRRCGKLIVATSSAELPQLESIQKRAAANGVDDLRFLDAKKARRLEPKLNSAGALLSPSTGIIDSHGYMLALQADAESGGTVVAFRTPFDSAQVEPDGILVRTGGAEPTTLKTRMLVNAAGIWATVLAGRIEGLDEAHIPHPRYAKGNYFSLAGATPFSHLIYPVPEPGGLGVHLTLDLGGQARFGPDVEWVDSISYHVDPHRSDSFYEKIRRYWPELRDNALSPAYAGIRPKISGAAGSADDFRISGPAEHGISGLVNLFGIESPGLTSSLALAELVAARLTGD